MKVGIFSALYFLAHQISFYFPASQQVMMYIWPASGIGLAGLLLSPRRAWLPMLAGYYLAGVSADVWIAHRPFWASLCYMTANNIESFGCALLILRTGADEIRFDRLREVFALFAGAVLINAFTAALGAAASVVFLNAGFMSSWVGWYIPDGLGILILVPFILAFARPRLDWTWPGFLRAAELGAFLVVWCLMCWYSLVPPGEASGFSFRLYPYMLIALLAWPAMRFGSRGLALALVILSGLAIADLILHGGLTSLGGKDAQGRLTEVQVFIAFAAFTGYTLAALHTESQVTQQSLKAALERLRLATAAGRLGVWDWDIATNRLEWDDRTSELYGLGRKPATGAYEVWLERLHPEDAGRCHAQIQEALAGKQDYDTEFRTLWPDGTIKHIKAFGRVTRDGQGHAVRLTGVNYDISEQREAEARQRELEKQLIQSQRLEAIGTLSSGIAHDFNNILGIILGNVDLLALRAKGQEPLNRYIESIQKATERGSEVVKQLLTFARKTVIHKQPSSINGLILETVKLLGETLPKTILLRTELDDSLPPANVDPNQIHQVLLNLSLNAKDAMPSGGVLAFSSSTVSGNTLKHTFPEARSWPYLCVRIEDTGTGMDPETLRQIFDPFFSTKEKGKGTGLGVPVAQGIIRNHDGFIDVQSEPGRGTVFSFYLPVLESAEARVLPEEADVKDIPGGSETILLIEDEPAMRAILTELLMGKGYTVLQAEDGEAGLGMFRMHREEIALVLSDFGLPKLGGDEVYAQMKATGGPMRFILMTGYIEPGSHQALLEGGIREILSKPCSPDTLLRAVRSALDSDRG